MTQLSRYTVFDKIGSSILGVVYRAQDTVTGSMVALKVLQLGMLDDVGSREMDARLQHEFEIASRLLHPGIARVLEIQRDGTTALIAMELVDGPTVTAFANALAGSDPSAAVTAAVQILEALDFAHRHGAIHRDLKPSNILVSQGTRTKITDFGMADLGARNRDDTGMLVGETQYMAPEQFLGRVIDNRCDIYAVGTIFYELLTGKSPFAADPGSYSAMTNVLKLIPPPPSTVRRDLPPAFDAVVGRALAKSPADRFASAQHFRDELCAAYFALMRRAPPGTLARMPTAPELPASSAARTITIRRGPSWSQHDPAPPRPEPPNTAPEAPRGRHADQPPPQSTVHSLGSNPVDPNRVPHRAAAPPAPEPLGPTRSVPATPPAEALVARARPQADTPPPPEPAAASSHSRASGFGSGAPMRDDRQPARFSPTPPADVRSDSVAARATPAKQIIPLTEASIAHGGRVLARFVGPIAGVLSRRAAQDAHDERSYFELLAAHLADPKERARFFRDIRQRHS